MVQFYYDKYTAIADNVYTTVETELYSETYTDAKNEPISAHLNRMISNKQGSGTTISPLNAFSEFKVDKTGTVVAIFQFTSHELDKTTFQTLYNTDSATSTNTRYFFVNAIGLGVGAYRIGMRRDYIDSVSYYITIKKITSKIVSTTYSKGALVQSKIVAEEGAYPSDGRHTDGYWYVKGTKANTAPTVTLTSPSNNQTLYENDTINISGDAYDADKDQSVTAYYQLNSEPKKVLATNLSQMQISLSKQLTFKGGKLYDGESVLTGMLAEGVEHKLKIWAVDSEGAQSTTVERTFYVVPNRAPLLSIDTIVPSGIIDMDKFIISGTALDEDANSSVKVTRRINANNPVEIYSGKGGEWEFEILLSQLVVGANTIVIEVVDNYGAKTSKTIKLNKNAVNAPILQSVARYKVEPPKGSAKGVLLWVQRDTDLDLKVDLSMILKGEQESYVPLTAMHTVLVYEGVVEDEFYYETLDPKDDIILKLTTTRPNINVDHKIHLIMGVLE